MQAELLGAALALVCLAAVLSSQPAEGQAAEPLAHSHTEFHFSIAAPLETAFPLFGAEEERKWAPGWDPQFVHPTPAKDQQGSVFLVQHRHGPSVWTTTAFDLAAGHVQYVYVIHDVMVTLIDIHLTSQGTTKTGVSVVYERTALAPEAHEHVRQSARQDEGFGKEWEEQINGYLEKSRAR